MANFYGFYEILMLFMKFWWYIKILLFRWIHPTCKYNCRGNWGQQIKVTYKNNITTLHIPEGLPSLKVDTFQMAMLAWKSWPIQKLTPLLYEKLLKFEGKKWSYFYNFHTLTWPNKHLKFHFRGYFTKSSFWHLKSEARAKIFTVLIAWLGSVNFAFMCHSGTSKGFGAVRVSWSEADHHRSRRLFDIWLWQFYEKVIEKL